MSRTGKLALAVAGVVLLVAAAGWLATSPRRLDAASVAAAGPGNAQAGERVFRMGGCASCHAAPDATGEARRELAGGLELKTAFGTFVVPNISPDREDGIGQWSFADFANAVQRGVAPDGSHFYPAFPYPSYARMTLADTADLFAFLHTLPPVKSKPPASRISFPYNIRRGIGLWNLAFLRTDPVIALPQDADPMVLRGRYIVEGPGHCGECHTPRNAAGGVDRGQWLAGAVNPDGEGSIPNLTPSADGLKDWSAQDIAYYLESGFTPDFDSVGGSMVEVQANMSKLPASDREAIAAYLKAIPARSNGYPPEKPES
jgi:mono/diheme cytochrome c family protein